MKIKVKLEKGVFVYYFDHGKCYLYCGEISTMSKRWVTLRRVQKYNDYDGLDNSRDLVNKRIWINRLLVSLDIVKDVESG